MHVNGGSTVKWGLVYLDGQPLMDKEVQAALEAGLNSQRGDPAEFTTQRGEPGRNVSQQVAGADAKVGEFRNIIDQRIRSFKSGLVHSKRLLEGEVPQILRWAALSDQEHEVFLRFSISFGFLLPRSTASTEESSEEHAFDLRRNRHQTAYMPAESIAHCPEFSGEIHSLSPHSTG